MAGPKWPKYKFTIKIKVENIYFFSMVKIVVTDVSAEVMNLQLTNHFIFPYGRTRETPFVPLKGRGGLLVIVILSGVGFYTAGALGFVY